VHTIPSRVDMARSAVRVIALLVLVLLGAPLATHVIVHDLHEHRGASKPVSLDGGDHGDHEHPIVNAPAPARIDRSSIVVATVAVVARVTTTILVTEQRNLLSVGALRIDDDVGLQAFLSTFLI
jgi:hypothetical protein